MEKIGDKGFWELPNMRIHKADLKSVKEGVDNFKEWCETIDKLTHADMEIIAKHISRGLMAVWNETVETVAEHFINCEDERKVEIHSQSKKIIPI